MNLNRVQIIGNLTRDPEGRAIPSGARVVTFGVAVNERYGQKDETIFFKVDAWGKTGEIAERYLRKGSLVYVEGRLRIEEYTTREGEKRRDVAITANNIVLGPKGRGGDDGGQDDRGGESRGRYSDEPRRDQGFREEAPAREYRDYDRQETNEPSPSQGGGDTPEDDLPF